MSTDLYQARTSAPDPARPLVFAFHGTGGDENQLFELASQIVPGAGVVSPRGDVSEGGAARFFRRTGEGVYDMDDLARATAKMTAFVAAHRAAHPGHPVYAFGYSNGANILASVFLKRPDLFDRVGLLHPLVTWGLAPNPALEDRPVLVTAGRRDPITPLPMSEQLIAWLKAQGADVQTDVHDGGHELRNTELTALTRLFGGQH
ncbi:alpha/beta hydrolase [Tateyamaria sp. syn59]|uniref:alpha/beta hydrolase n=1 Tax=Tateyamaria sp. syn59 TaxID=2576942 RepID=UPI0011BE1CB2|nr:alpha/beta hydrolase [Tateyamaria sp. syn59]